MTSFISAARIFGHLVIFLSPILLTSCRDQPLQNTRSANEFKHYEQRVLVLANSKEVLTYIADNDAKQTKGLSGIASKDFQDNHAMFFPGEFDQDRRFWMPDTYFNLDIFFLNKELKVLEIQRNVTHHPGHDEPPKITRTKNVFCRHVLEIRSSSPLAKEIRFGQKLKWKD